jgi:polyisoprenoid-binding protein YceI
MLRVPSFVFAACLVLALAGCATAPATVPTTVSAAPARAAQPATTQAPAATAPAAAGVSRWTLDAASSEARFRAREQLAGHDLPSDAIGRTKTVQGVIVVDKQGTVVRDQSKFEVDLNNLTSDESRRDNFIKRNTLETARFPSAVFIPTAVSGLPSPIPDTGEGKFQLTGDMTIHGVTRSVTWDVSAKKSGNQLTGTASTVIKLVDFGMTPPKVPLVLSIEDNITLEIDFTLAQG